MSVERQSQLELRWFGGLCRSLGVDPDNLKDTATEAILKEIQLNLTPKVLDVKLPVDGPSDEETAESDSDATGTSQAGSSQGLSDIERSLLTPTEESGRRFSQENLSDQDEPSKRESIPDLLRKLIPLEKSNVNSQFNLQAWIARWKSIERILSSEKSSWPLKIFRKMQAQQRLTHFQKTAYQKDRKFTSEDARFFENVIQTEEVEAKSGLSKQTFDLPVDVTKHYVSQMKGLLPLLDELPQSRAEVMVKEGRDINDSSINLNPHMKLFTLLQALKMFESFYNEDHRLREEVGDLLDLGGEISKTYGEDWRETPLVFTGYFTLMVGNFSKYALLGEGEESEYKSQRVQKQIDIVRDGFFTENGDGPPKSLVEVKKHLLSELSDVAHLLEETSGEKLTPLLDVCREVYSGLKDIPLNTKLMTRNVGSPLRVFENHLFLLLDFSENAMNEEFAFYLISTNWHHLLASAAEELGVDVKGEQRGGLDFENIIRLVKKFIERCSDQDKLKVICNFFETYIDGLNFNSAVLELRAISFFRSFFQSVQDEIESNVLHSDPQFKIFLETCANFLREVKNNATIQLNFDEEQSDLPLLIKSIAEANSRDNDELIKTLKEKFEFFIKLVGGSLKAEQKPLLVKIALKTGSIQNVSQATNLCLQEPRGDLLGTIENWLKDKSVRPKWFERWKFYDEVESIYFNLKQEKLEKQKAECEGKNESLFPLIEQAKKLADDCKPSKFQWIRRPFFNDAKEKFKRHNKAKRFYKKIKKDYVAAQKETIERQHKKIKRYVKKNLLPESMPYFSGYKPSFWRKCATWLRKKLSLAKVQQEKVMGPEDGVNLSQPDPADEDVVPVKSTPKSDEYAGLFKRVNRISGTPSFESVTSVSTLLSQQGIFITQAKKAKAKAEVKLFIDALACDRLSADFKIDKCLFSMLDRVQGGFDNNVKNAWIDALPEFGQLFQKSLKSDDDKPVGADEVIPALIDRVISLFLSHDKLRVADVYKNLCFLNSEEGKKVISDLKSLLPQKAEGEQYWLMTLKVAITSVIDRVKRASTCFDFQNSLADDEMDTLSKDANNPLLNDDSFTKLKAACDAVEPEQETNSLALK